MSVKVEMTGTVEDLPAINAVLQKMFAINAGKALDIVIQAMPAKAQEQLRDCEAH